MNVLRAGTIYAAANVAAAAVPFLLLPVLTRELDPAAFGQVVQFMIIMTICIPIAGLSIHGAIGAAWFNRPRETMPQFVAAAATLVAVVTLSVSIVTFGIATAYPQLVGGLPPTWAALAAITAGANVLLQCRLVLWQSQQKPIANATVQIGGSVLNIALSLFFIFALGWGGEGRNAGITVSACLMALFAVCLLARSGDMRLVSAGFDHSQRLYADLLRFGVPLVPHALAGAVLVNADRIAVSTALGGEALGIYGVAWQLGSVMTVLTDAATKAFTPVAYQLLQTNTEQARLRIVGIAYTSILVWPALALLLWVLLLFLGPHFIGPQFHGALPMTLWFLLGGAAVGVYLNVAGLFFFSGKTEWISAATIGAAAFAIVVAPYAVAMGGLNGAGATFLASQIMILALAWALSLRVVPMPWQHPVAAFRELRQWQRQGPTPT